MKLRAKVILLVLGVLLISMTMLSLPLYWYTRAALEEALGDQLIRLSHIVSQNLDQEYLEAISREPHLHSVRGRIENSLMGFTTAGVEGITLYRRDGLILAEDRRNKTNIDQLSEVLPSLLSLKVSGEAVVSEIYEMNNGTHVKAVALPISTRGEQDVVLVIWAGAAYMQVIKQLQGSLLWIVIASVIMALAMTVVFSRSLIRPVHDLSKYAKAIQANIKSDPIQLNRRDELGDLSRSLVDMHTEIKKQEESARQLLAGIAHEIKNPLGGMEIYSGLLKAELSELPHDEGTEASRYLNKISTELHHLTQIVQEYLDYARPLKSVIESVSIKEVFEDVHIVLRPELTAKDQTLVLSRSATVRADRSKLHRVFLNLIQNGLAATTTGGHVEVDVLEGKDTLDILFKDDGIGIPEADKERIFEPYFSTQDRGYGLGLTIVQSILADLGGTIVVQKSDENGTIFKTSLPKKNGKEA